MKMIKKIALGACALALFGGAFVGCSNAASDNNPLTQQPTTQPTQTTTTANGTGSTEQTQTQTQSASTEYTELWSGTSELAWGKGDKNGEYFTNDKLSANAKGLRITYTTDNTDDHCLKFLQGDSWQDIALDSVSGSGELASSGTDAGKAVWLWKGQTNATVSILWKAGSEDETKVLSKGIKVYGNGATLTKIELYTPASTATTTQTTTTGTEQTQTTTTGTEQTQTTTTGTEQTQSTTTGTEQTQTTTTGTEQTQTTTTGTEQTQTQTTTTGTGVLFEDNAGWTEDWNAKTFEAAKFADAVTGSQIKFTVRKNTDQYVKTNSDGSKDYSDCYSIIQLMDGDNKLTGGTITGGEIEVAGGNLKPLYKNADNSDDYDESHVYTMVYTPSAAEIATLKANGVKVQAHGTRILKIEFISNAQTSATVVLLDGGEEGWTQDWNAKAFEAAKVANAVTGSQIKFTVRKNTDQYVKTNSDGSKDYSDCYSIIQLMDGDNKLTGGTITGGEIEVAGGNLKPLYKNADNSDDYDESHVYTMVYTPSAAEIATLKTGNVKVQAHGTRIMKIEFVPTPANN